MKAGIGNPNNYSSFFHWKSLNCYLTCWIICFYLKIMTCRRILCCELSVFKPIWRVKWKFSRKRKWGKKKWILSEIGFERLEVAETMRFSLEFQKRRRRKKKWKRNYRQKIEVASGGGDEVMVVHFGIISGEIKDGVTQRNRWGLPWNSNPILQSPPKETPTGKFPSLSLHILFFHLSPKISVNDSVISKIFKWKRKGWH